MMLNDGYFERLNIGYLQFGRQRLSNQAGRFTMSQPASKMQATG